MNKQTPREELIDVAMNKLAPHLDTRCTSCAGSGVSIRSGQECMSCDGSGFWPDYKELARRSVAEVVDAMIARHVLHGFKENAVLQQAIGLCVDSLGDDVLWAATTLLRESLTDWNGGVWPPKAE